jgi:hypothetical protein
MSERRACRLVNQPRGTQRYQLTQREDEDALTQAIVELASQYGRYGYRRIMALLKRDGWQVGKDRVERAHLASRRAEGSTQTEAARAVVVQRWILRAAAAGACEPCMVVRLRQREDARWQDGEDVELDRRAQQRVSDDPAGTKMDFGEGHRSAGRRDGDEGRAEASSLRQRPRVRRQRSAEVARRHGSEDSLHRAGKPMGERLLRELQLEAAG